MKNKKVIVIIATLVVIIGIAVAAICLVLAGNKKKSTTEESKTEVTEEQTTAPATGDAITESVSPAAASATPKPTVKPVKYPVNVTKEAKADVLKLMKRFEAYICLTQESDQEVPWNSNTRTMAAIYQLNYVTNELKYNCKFSEAKKKAEEELANTWVAPVTFTMKPSVDFYGTLYSKNDGKLSYNGGDWGDVTFKSKIKKVVLKKNGSYFVKYGTAPVSEQDKKSNIELKYYFVVLRKSDSKYGYKIEQIKTYSKRDAKRFR